MSVLTYIYHLNQNNVFQAIFWLTHVLQLASKQSIQSQSLLQRITCQKSQIHYHITKHLETTLVHIMTLVIRSYYVFNIKCNYFNQIKVISCR